MGEPLTGIMTSTYTRGRVTIITIQHISTGKKVTGTTTGSKTILRSQLLDELRRKVLGGGT